MLLFFVASNYTNKTQDAQDHTDQGVKTHQRADDTENDANERNVGKNADQPAENSGQNEESDQLKEEGCGVALLDLKDGRPKLLLCFSVVIHLFRQSQRMQFVFKRQKKYNIKL